MKNITFHTGTLKDVRRLKSSVNGNPRFSAWVDEGAGHRWTFKTKVDSSYGYCIKSLEGKRVVASIGTHYGTTQLESIRAIE
jgi:hypothetical protein